jgi:nitrate/TMAO reductase-like tetraheme cytochrome c subunit
MNTSWFLPVLLGLALAFAAWLYWSIPRLSAERGGRIILLLALLVLPLLLLPMGVARTLGASQSREFCNSCHEMGTYEQSLFYDDSEFVPANHFQKRLVPTDTACFACHTDYTLYGDVAAKLNGLKHVLIHFTGQVPDKGEIKLYAPYPNANCLKCHAGSRTFDGVAQHDSEEVKLDDLYSNRISCSNKGCHDSVHAIKEQDELDLWRPSGRAGSPVVPMVELPPPAPAGSADEDSDDLWGDDEAEPAKDEAEPAKDEAEPAKDEAEPAKDEAEPAKDEAEPAVDKEAPAP